MKIIFNALKMPQSGCLAVFVSEDKKLAGLARDADNLSGGAITKAMKVGRFEGGKGQTLDIIAPSCAGDNDVDLERILVVGLGNPAKLENRDQLALGAKIYASFALSGSTDMYIAADFEGSDSVALAEGASMRAYRFDKYRTKETKDKKPSLENIIISAENPITATTLFADRNAVVAGARFSRELASETPNILTPAEFAKQIQGLAELGIDVEILGESEMEKLGMHALLGVGLGSENESKLAIMRWNGGGDELPVAFVGKGVTFDTGGISLKPGAGMEQMKWDMGGAGIVTGLMKSLAGRKAAMNVVGVVGLVENMPDGRAQRPGDVVTSMSGQTIEILNTDAEGRLVLADALWYTQDRFKPSLMIDLATLTGAIIVSLGHEYAGFFTDDNDIANGLSEAGDYTGDKVWRLPLHPNYDKLIDTPTADVKNLGSRGAGSITAAQFLKRFTNNVPWAHIDVAGVVWSDKDLPLSEKGATGYGVRLLDRFVSDLIDRGNG